MELVGCGVVALVLVAVAILLGLALKASYGVLDKEIESFRTTIEPVVSSRPGVSYSGGGWDGLTLQYRRIAWSAEVTWGRRQDGAEYTRFEVILRKPTKALFIRRQGFITGLSSLWGTGDIRIGDPAFDALYVIQAEPTQFAREFLTPEARRLIEVLRSLNDEVVLLLQQRRLHLQVLTHLRGEGVVSRFLTACESLANLAAGGDAPVDPGGVEFVELSQPEGGECQICGHDMDEALVHCAKCRTKHHQQCWEYYGSCSTFGCGETSYSSPS